ncbi:hypothetical protein ACWGQ5_43625 [Streptomyces sp. NPDC055722]
MSTKVVDTSTMSAECALAQRPGYTDLHRQCRQTEDVPLPHNDGILLVRRCTCTCTHHAYSRKPADAGPLHLVGGTTTGSPTPEGGYAFPAEGTS